MNSIEYIRILMIREIKLYEIEIMALLTLSPGSISDSPFFLSLCMPKCVW